MRRKGREESDRFFSLLRRRAPIIHAHSGRSYNNGHHVATKAKHPKYWRKSRHSVAVAKWGETRGYSGPGPTKYLSLGSNLYCLVRVILLHGQTVTFLALGSPIVESFVVIERDGTRAISLPSRSQALPLQLPFYSALTELRVSLSLFLARRGTRGKAPTPLDERWLVRLTPKSGVRCASLGVKDHAAVNTNGTPPRASSSLLPLPSRVAVRRSARRREHSVKAPLVNPAPRTVIDGKSRC